MINWQQVYLVKSKGLCHSKSPSLFKSSTDHSGTGRRRSRGQAKWVWKLDSTDLNADIYLIYGTVEQRQLWNQIHRLSIARLQKTNIWVSWLLQSEYSNNSICFYNNLKLSRPWPKQSTPPQGNRIFSQITFVSLPQLSCSVLPPSSPSHPPLPSAGRSSHMSSVLLLFLPVKRDFFFFLLFLGWGSRSSGSSYHRVANERWCNHSYLR